MKLRNLEIKNFRNFKHIAINLENRNIVFGMNDIGKTNFLYAIRFLLDKEIRKNGFKDSDYYRKNTSENIEIILTIGIDDYEEDEDTKKLIAKMHGAVGSDYNEIYIKLESEYDDREDITYPKMYWGDKKDELLELNSIGPSYPIDEVFKIIYINPLINLETVFKVHKKSIFEERNAQEKDITIRKDIDAISKSLNEKISELSLVEQFQDHVTTHYKDLRKEDISIELKSEMEIKGYYNNLVPYIKRDNDSNHYPTGGDGRRKLLSYSIMNLVNKKESQQKILIHLVEEPENSLHKSMQIALSKQLFNSASYKNLFVSTHSAPIIYEMDNVNLIRIYSSDKIECCTYAYRVSEEYKSVKKKLTKNLSEAIFSERVLLIEGPSEKVLFDKVMEEINPEYEIDGGYILDIGGIGFKPYIDILNGLGIISIVKTDNDLKKSFKKINKNRKDGLLEYEVYGFNRVLPYINEDKLPNIEIANTSDEKENKSILINKKREIFNINKEIVERLNSEYKIFLSEVDLENDLYRVIKNELDEYTDTSNVVEYLQSKKLYNLVGILNKLSFEDCKKIYNSEEFKCLREL
ncbi:MAG: AAA family ATPase [Paeniclostridium sordellii]|nr:AAA family ATPase [[Eubacterium] tenue]MDU2591513.1 AAA family ATPase [Paeniclostridium sordellii]